MVSLSTLGLLAALAAPIFSLPHHQENAVQQKRQDDHIPTVIGVTFTLPLQHTETSSVMDPEPTDDVEVPEINPCAFTLCMENTTCEVIDGVAQCLPLNNCGPTVCSEGLVCCNESCGICTPPGGFCIMLYCGSTIRPPLGPNDTV